MKNTFLLLLFIVFTIIGLSACVKNQDAGTAATSPPPPDQSVNNTNYQQIMEEQSLRAQEQVAEHPHVGGHR